MPFSHQYAYSRSGIACLSILQFRMDLEHQIPMDRHRKRYVNMALNYLYAYARTNEKYLNKSWGNAQPEFRQIVAAHWSNDSLRRQV